MLLYNKQHLPMDREGNGTPLQYSCLENPMDEGAWKAAIHGVAKSQTRLSDFIQGTLKSLLQHHSSKAWILQCSAIFMVQLSHPYMTTGKTIALTRRTFFGKVMSLLFNMLSRLVQAFLPRSKYLLISWLQSPCATKYLLSRFITSSVPSLCWEG